MRLIIKKLFGKYDYDIDFNKPINILIGENGCGKSTILKILYYLGKRDFISLANVKFEELTISNKKYSETIVRNDLLQHSFVNNHDFRRSFFRFLLKSLENVNMVISNKVLEVDEIKSFDEFYNNLLIKYANGAEVYSNKVIADSEEHFKQYLSADTLFYFGVEYNDEYDDYAEQRLEKYYETFQSKNKSLFGSKIYFKNLFNFFLECQVLTIVGGGFLSRNRLAASFYNKYGYPGDVSFSSYDEDEIIPFPEYWPHLETIVYKVNIYDYVDFVETGYNVFNQFKNIGFYNSDTAQSMLDKVCELMGDKQDDYCEPIRLSEIKGWEKIENFCSSLIYDVQSRKRAFFPWSLGDTIKEKQEKWEDFVAKMHPDHISETIRYGLFLTDGYDYKKVFEYIEKNYEKLIKDNPELQIFNTLIQRYISNKKIKVNDKKLSIQYIEKMDIFDITDKNGTKLAYDQLSSGEKKIIRLIMMIAFDKKWYRLLLIDEPELSLSPFWQEMLLDDIKKYCKECKVIIATQSPNLINDEQLDWLIEVKKEA